jgi:hypothetical protein
MARMDRPTRLYLAQAIVERTRDYTKEAFNDLFEAMDAIERRHELIPKLTADEEAQVAVAEEKLARGEKLPDLEYRASPEDYLLESEASTLGRVRALPQEEQDHILSMVRLLSEIDAPRLRLSPEQIADLRLSLRETEGQ